MDVFLIHEVEMGYYGHLVEVVVATPERFVNWFSTNPTYRGTADEDDIRTHLEEELNYGKFEFFLGKWRITVYREATVLPANGGRRRKTHKQKRSSK
jgi:hypothetical protein